MQQKRTIVYVDGFNLYYGSLRKTDYKWLDLKRLFTLLLGETHAIQEIKYFTAKISPRDKTDKSPDRQKLYLLAISKYIQELKIYYGHYLTSKIMAKVCEPTSTIPKFIQVFKTEEKGSDVNLALHILNDAWLNKYDCAVLVSNDGDIAEALRFVKEEHQKMIGLIVPGNDKYRKAAVVLSKYADFTLRISKKSLTESQLPEKIPGTNLYKPIAW
ncbi:MAG: NYN domain-containing protein [Legionellales bacterium]|nr:NYN domain-containing protein [Legionellales bacterium]